AIRNGQLDPDVIRRVLGILSDDVEVSALVEGPGIDQLELTLVPGPAMVLGDEPVVGKRGLRILVEGLAIGRGRRGVEVIVGLLDVLAVIAFRPGQTEGTFLEDGVLTVPEGDGEAETTFAIGEAEQAILAPAISP